MKLALGTAQIGLDYGVANTQGKVSPDEARKILEVARSAGISTLDTAVAYGDSEARLGEIGIAGCDVVSKLPALPEDVTDVGAWARGLVEQSLANLKVDRLYGLLLHRPLQLMEPRGDELYAALQELRADGLVGKTGGSIHVVSDLEGLYDRYHLDLVQTPFNLFDQRLVETGWMQRLTDGGTELHVRSIFLQGVLLYPPGQRPAKFSRWADHFREYDAWMGSHGRTAVEACVTFALSFPEIDKVVVGVDSAAQLQTIVAAAGKTAPPFPPGLASNDRDLLDPLVWMRR